MRKKAYLRSCTAPPGTLPRVVREWVIALRVPTQGTPLVGPVTAVAGCGETGDPQPRHRLVMAP